MYGFAGGDPINFSDPFGLCASEEDAGDGSDSTDTEKKPKLSCVYQQQSGQLTCSDESGKTVVDEKGYAGRSFAKNSPASQNLMFAGPIPLGRWFIGGVKNSKGPLTITLTPAPETNTYFRDLFRFHGDSRAHPGEASEGCIIMSRPTRQTIANSSGSTLRVVP